MTRHRTETIGDATLYLGDCRDILPTLGRVDAVVTSPPYGQQRNYGNPIDDWRSVVSTALCSIVDYGSTQVLVNLGLIHRDGSVVRYWDDLINDMTSVGWRLFGWYVWDQGDGLAGSWGGRLAPAHEWIFHFNRQARVVNKTKRTLGGVIKGPGLRKPDGSSETKQSGHGQPIQPFKIPDSIIRSTRDFCSGVQHPARFPVKFATELVVPFSNAGETILDPFMGSGTTGVACMNLGRKFIGIELHEPYFDIACRRIEQAWKQPRLFEEPKPKAVQEALDL